MSLLSYLELVELAREGVIEGVNEDAINSASIDIHLGNKILVERKNLSQGPDSIKWLNKKSSLEMEPVNLGSDGVYVLAPGEFILAQSREIFHLPNTISAEYKLKSSMARLGLEHLNAGWCDAGWNGSVLTLELKNMTEKHRIAITVGDRIGQVVFFAHKPVPQNRSYATRGSYNNDKQVQGVKTK